MYGIVVDAYFKKKVRTAVLEAIEVDDRSEAMGCVLIFDSD